jgi:hypothetical protein
LEVTIEHEEYDEVSEQISVQHMHHLLIKLALAQPVEVSASFRHEHAGHKLVKLFRHEFQVGDARFDDAIYIHDDHRPATEALLAISGAREAILALVSAYGTVKIDHGSVEFETRGAGAVDVAGCVEAALALSRHIASVT